MKTRLKVYGGNLFSLGEQIRVVMAARSLNQVATILGETHYTISRMWTETGNKTEIQKAQESPLRPVVVSCLSRNQYERSLEELQKSVESAYKPRTYKRPYIRHG